MRVALLTLTIILCSLGTALAQELAVELFPLDQLKPGQMGIGKTVVRGVEIEEFNVEVLELIPEGGFDGGPMVLARFSGPVVDFSNGIAGGYSGSPVYIDGKLLGAVSMAMPFTDTHVGGITPIQQMLKALPVEDEPDYTGNTVLPKSEDNGVELDEDGARITYFDDPQAALAFNEQSRARGETNYGAVLAKSPLFFSNLSPTVLSAFGDKFKALLGPQLELMEKPMGKAADYGLFLAQGADRPGLLLNPPADAPPLLPGDAIAVSLIRGDIEIYAVGTLTYSDENGQFLCFGHPMFQGGSANFPIGKAYITWTYPSIQRAFKDGVRLNSVGTMTRDHAAACGGSFNVEPDMIPVRFKITDIDTGLTESMKFEVIRHADFTPMLLAMGMSQAALEVLDRTPGGTLKLSYHVEGAGLKEPLRRTNFYYDDVDVISAAAMELVPISGLLESNIYREVDVTKVEILLEITRNRINASIDDAEIIQDEEEDAAAEEAEPVDIAPDAPASEMPGTVMESTASGWRLQEPQPGAPGSEIVPPPGTMPYGLEPMGNIPTFHPGEEIRVKVRLQPFRTDPVWREFSVTVPDDFPSGQTSIVVHGGGDLISFDELSGKGRFLFGMGPVIDIQERDLDSILDQIMEWPFNNELLITLQRPYDPSAAQELGMADEDEQPEQAVDAKYQMEWVIYNGFMIPVNIMTESEEAQMEAMMQSGDEQAYPDAEIAPSADETSPPPADDVNEPEDDGDDDGEGEEPSPIEPDQDWD